MYGYNKLKDIREELEITEDYIVDTLRGLPQHKKHCSNFGVAGLRNDIKDYIGIIAKLKYTIRTS